MNEPMTDADLARIEGLLAVGAIEVVYGRERDPDAVKMLVAEVRRLREQLSEREACSHGIVTECRECGLAAFSWEFDRLRARGAQLGDGDE